MSAETRKTDESKFRQLTAGDPAPWFSQECSDGTEFGFDKLGGRYVALCLYGSAGDEMGREALANVEAHRAIFNDGHASFFGVSNDPEDKATGRVKGNLPGIRHYWDWDEKVSRLYGAIEPEPSGSVKRRRFWLVIDPMLRVMARFRLESHAQVCAYVKALPPPRRHVGFEIQAPVLVLPRVFEAEFCRELIALYDKEGGAESGVMREIEGMIVGVFDYAAKRRKDCIITDPELIGEIGRRIKRRVFPEIEKLYSCMVTRMERYIVGCYAAEDGAHFRPHRDNSADGSGHRQFAVSINLNNDFEGGEVRFPEFSPRGYKVPAGTALIFPGALLHAVGKVTKGRRYAFLPFVYDDEAGKIRKANLKYLDTGPARVVNITAPG